MKPTYLLFTILLVLPFSVRAQDRADINQIMIVKSYFVEHILETRIGPSHKPVYQRTISLAGEPQGESLMDQIELHFSTNKSINTQNPVIEAGMKKVTVWFPMVEFDYYYQLLNHKNGLLKATFMQKEAQQIRKLELVANGILPLED